MTVAHEANGTLEELDLSSCSLGCAPRWGYTGIPRYRFLEERIYAYSWRTYWDTYGHMGFGFGDFGFRCTRFGVNVFGRWVCGEVVGVKVFAVGLRA